MTDSNIKSKIEKWSRAHRFKTPKGTIIMFHNSRAEYVNSITGDTSALIENIISYEDYLMHDYSVQYISESYKSKLIVEKVPELDAIRISFIYGDYSSEVSPKKRTYVEKERFFLLRDKRVVRILDIEGSHFAEFREKNKSKLLEEMENVCPFSSFDSPSRRDYLFYCLADVFGPVAIITANNIVFFKTMQKEQFIKFIEYSEPEKINTKNGRKIQKYIESQELKPYRCIPAVSPADASPFIVFGERLDNGVAVLRCAVNMYTPDNKTYDVFRFYFDGDEVIACRKNNKGDWIAQQTKMITCSSQWEFMPIDIKIAEGHILKDYLYCLNKIDNEYKWSALIGMISYPWIAKLLDSKFAPVLLWAMKKSANTPYNAIVAIIGDVNEKGKRPNSILGMDNFQIASIAYYYSKRAHVRANAPEKYLIYYLRWIFNYPFCLSLQLTNTTSFKIKTLGIKREISDIDHSTFYSTLLTMENVIDSAQSKKEIEQFATCLYLLRTMRNNKKMVDMMNELLSCRQDLIIRSELKGVETNGVAPTERVLTLYMLYLYAVYQIENHFVGLKSKFMLGKGYNLNIRHLSKKLNLKTETPCYNNLVEKYNLAMSIFASQLERAEGDNTGYLYLFGWNYDFLDYEDDSIIKFASYLYKDPDEQFIIVAPDRTGDVAIEGLILNNFAKKEIISSAEMWFEILFVRRVNDIKSPYYTLKISNNALIEIAGFNNYYPSGNIKLLDFINRWCSEKGIVATAINGRLH